MFKQLINYAQIEDLKVFASDIYDDLEKRYPEMCKEIEERLYHSIYGDHFTDWSLRNALSQMRNEDNTIGGHWTLEQTSQIAKENGINLQTDCFNEYDWCYVLNMVYSDYFKAIPDEKSSYVRVARKFIEDKDASKGKAYKYYKAMSE